MTKVRKKIGNIPINTIKQDLQSTIDASVTQMQQDVTDFIDEETAQYPEIGGVFKYQRDETFIDVETDNKNRILSSRNNKGVKKEYVGFETPKISIGDCTAENVEDIENRTEVNIDSEGKILSYRKKDGTKVEPAGIETIKITLTSDGLSDLGKALKEGGYGNVFDWSDKEVIELPIPQVCAIVNFGVDGQATSKSDRGDYMPGINADIPTTLEYWDINGNYFKKPIILSAQGDSSMGYWIKNQAFDLDDGSTIKFGNWVSQDSFHIKKYYQDVFRGQCIVGYKLTEQVYQTRPYGERRPWDYLNQGGDTINAIGKFKQDFDTGALGHPDGFPIHVFFNGKDAGVYTFNLKKHRDNYYAKKDNAKNIILDGNLGWDAFWDGTIDWTAFEIRNPKSLKNVDGSKYDGDHPTEITGDSSVDATSAKVKEYMERLSGAYAAINADKTRETFEQYFNVPFFIDYFLIGNVVWHQDGFMKNWIWCTWDGVLWAPTVYDLDSIFGSFYNGTFVVPAEEYQLPKANVQAWTNTNTLLGSHIVHHLWDLYKEEIKERYKYLRNKGIFTTDNIVGILEEWLKHVGYDNLKNDIENICAIDGVIQVPSYRDGSNTYSSYPTTGGYYNSILRVKRWLDEHFAYLDSENIFNYINQ